MSITRINNNQISDASAGNAFVGVNAAAKLQNYSITSQKIANSLTYGSDLTISGNLTVGGTTTQINTNTVTIEDPLLLLASFASGTPAVDIGFVGDRGSSTNIAWIWKESAAQFQSVYTSSNVTNTTVTVSSFADTKVGNFTTVGTGTFGGNVGLPNLSLSGNITSALNVTGTITGGNLATGGTASATGNVTGGNVLTGGLMSSTGNITGGNVLTGGIVSSTGNVTGGNVLTGGLVSSTGNINGGNLVSAALVQGVTVSASGNVVGGNANITSAVNSATVSASGNVTGGNVLTGGIMSSTGNATHGNILTGGIVSAAGNITSGSGSYFIGNGSQLTGISSTAGTALTNGTTNITTAPSGNANVTIAGTSNVVVWATTGQYVTGLVSANGNVTGGNLLTGGVVSATGNINGGNLVSAALVSGVTVSASGNVTGGNVLTGGLVSATGNVTGGNVLTGGLVSATGTVTGSSLLGTVVSASGTVTGGNLATGGTASATGNITGGNVLTGGLVSAAGTVTGSSLLGAVVSASGNVTAGGNLNTNNIVGTAITITSTGGLTLAPTSNVSVNNRYINSLADPVQAQDAATKNYVDSVAQGLDVKAPVFYASTASIFGSGYTYNNGTSGVGATLTAAAVGNLTLDGTVVSAGQRILIKNETGAFVNNTTQSAAFNGIYTVTTAGSPSVAYVLTRTTDFDANTQMASAFTFIEQGTTNADTGWVCTTDNPITVGTTQIIFVQFSGAGTYTGGNAISLTGTVINAVYDGSTIGKNGSNQLYIPANAPLVTPNIGAATGTSLSVTGTVTSSSVVGGVMSGTSVSVSGNVTGGNVNTGGVVSATGNITGGNVLFGSGVVTGTGNITGGKVLTGGLISATGTVTGGNLATGGTISGTGNITGGNVLTGGLISATGTISSTGNITGGNVLTGGLMSSTGNITGGNVLTGGLVSATGNLTSGNVNTGGLVSATGNVTGGNILTGGLISATGTVSATGTITGGNLATGGTASATGNITGGNVLTGGLISSTGNITGGNVLTTGIMSSTGNATHGNILTAGIISATGNVTGNSFIAAGTATTGAYSAILGNISNINLHQTAVAVMGGNANSSVQFAFQNYNALSNASTDLALYNNNGTDTTYYIDMGITSSTFNGTAYGANIYGANDGYLYVVGNSATGPMGSGANIGNLILGSTNGQVIVFVGNASTSNAITTTSQTGVAVTGVMSATGTVTGGNLATAGLGNIGNIRINVDDITTVGSNITFNSAAANINFRVSGTAANVLAVDAASNTVVIGSLTASATVNAALKIATTNSMIVPVGTTAQRPATPATGMLRYNSTQGVIEYYTANAWTTAGTTFTVITADSFTGNGACTTYTLSTASTTAATIVAINGVVQIPTTAYAVSGTTLTFTEAPSSQDIIDVRELTTTTTITGIQNVSGNATVTGNATAAEIDVTGNMVVSGTFSATGGIVGLSSNKIVSGTSQANIGTTNGNLVITIGGTAIAAFTANGIENQQANGVGNLGTATTYFNTVFAKATSAQYADLAEMYVADQPIEAGTVVAFGGNNEVTTCTVDASRRVAGVVSTNPSYLMNSGQAGEYVVPVALQGRVPVRVTGTVLKGDMMVATGDGRARAEADPAVGSVIGKALADFNGVDGVIEVVVGRV